MGTNWSSHYMTELLSSSIHSNIIIENTLKGHLIDFMGSKYYCSSERQRMGVVCAK